MFNAQLWKMTRHLFDDKNTAQSLTLGVGAGVGLFVAGVAVFPALVSASVVTAGAGVLRSYWDEFKRKTFPSTHDQLRQAWKETPEANDYVSPLNKASKYNNFLETVESALGYKEKHTLADVSWLKLLSDKIDWAIDTSQRRGEGIETLQNVKEQTRIVGGPIASKAASAAFNTAMDRPIKNDVSNLIDAVNDLNSAIELNRIAKSMSPVEDTKTTPLYGGRELHLKNKFNVLKKTIEQGVFIGSEEPARMESGIRYIMDTVVHIDSKLNPIVPTMLRENTTVGQEKNKMPYAQLEAAWGKTFLLEPERSYPASVLNAYATFDATLSAYAEQNGASVSTVELASLMHQRLSYTLQKQSPDEKTSQGIEKLLSKTARYLVENAPGVASQAVSQIDTAAPLSSYSDVSIAAGTIRSAAIAQAVAASFAPNPETDGARAQKLEQQFARIQASVAIGLTADDKFFPNLGKDTPQESVNASIAQASYQMGEMRRALMGTEQASTLAMN